MSNELNHWKEMFNELDTIDGWFREEYENESEESKQLKEINESKNG